MRLLAILVSITLLCPGVASLADDGALPICADEEFLAFFNMVVEHQLLFDGDITSASMLNRASREQMVRRETYQRDLPLCADAIAIERLLIQLGGDALARSALDLAGLPADDNPYHQRLPSDQARIESLLSARLGLDRTQALPPDERAAPACEPDDWAQLDAAAAALLAAADSASDQTAPSQALTAIDKLLRWREAYIEALPQCAESIELIRAISAAATDSAAYHAFTYGGVSLERNPFPPLLEASIATVASWRDTIPPALREQAAPSSIRALIADRLPSCAYAELSGDIDDLQTDYGALIERAEAAVTSARLAEFGEAQIAFRNARLAELPLCAEALEVRWWVSEALADIALHSAIDAGAPASIWAPRPYAAKTNYAARASSSWGNLESALQSPSAAQPTDAGAWSIAAESAAPECGDGDHIFVLTYLVPKLTKLIDAALNLSQPDDLAEFIADSYAFRQLLWANLPRCADALETGLIMRSVAADTVAMLALELAGAPVVDSPYLPKIAGDIKRFSDWTNEFNATCGSINGTTTTYYVVAENIANIRACASTNCSIVTTANRGQRLDVVDDLSNWYEIVLPSCETAYIAGFLASQTPPAR